MDMEITTIGPDGTRTSTVENTCVIKLLWKVMGMASNGMNRKVIQACFPSRGGTYAVWYAGNDEKIKAHAEDFLRNPAASFMHRCIRWGFKTEDVVNMINVCFDAHSARTALASKWEAKNRRVICEAIDSVEDDLRLFREQFWGPCKTNQAADIVVQTTEKPGDIGNFDFAASSNSVGQSDSGYKTMADPDTSKMVFDEKTVVGEEKADISLAGFAAAAAAAAAAADDAGYETQLECGYNPPGAVEAEEMGDDMSDISGYQSRACSYDDLEKLAQLGKGIGEDTTDPDEVCLAFQEFLR
jgi:hypothetical protein